MWGSAQSVSAATQFCSQPNRVKVLQRHPQMDGRLNFACQLNCSQVGDCKSLLQRFPGWVWLHPFVCAIKNLELWKQVGFCTEHFQLTRIGVETMRSTCRGSACLESGLGATKTCLRRILVWICLSYCERVFRFTNSKKKILQKFENKNLGVRMVTPASEKSPSKDFYERHSKVEILSNSDTYGVATETMAKT